MTRYWGIVAVLIANAVAFRMSLDYRWPYMDQIPVHDLDVTTSVAVMWARSWWSEGPLNLGFALPYAPLSIETPTLASRRVYESWPPGLVVPIYLSAVILGQEPSVPMVNWINVISHGLTAVFVSLTAYVVGRLCGWQRLSSALLAAGVPFVALLQRGPLYFFSQIYTMDPHVLVYVSAFVFLECLYHYRTDSRARRAIGATLPIIAVAGCLVDWLMYFVIAVWIAGRFVARWLGVAPQQTLRSLAFSLALPFVSFGLFLAWRFSLEGSLARTQGLQAALLDIFWKASYRAGLQADYPVPKPFGSHLWWMHEYFFSPITPGVLTVGGIALILLAAVAWWRAGQAIEDRRRVFLVVFATALLTLPVYGQMFAFRQHTEIHPFSSAKILMPYAFVPFVALPMLLAAAGSGSFRVRRPVVEAVIAAIAATGAIEVGFRHEVPLVIGRVDRPRMELWETIRRNVRYSDVVFSPELVAPPFKVEMGISNKVIYPAKSFLDISKRVAAVCGPLSVVIVFPGDVASGSWSGHAPTQIIRDGGLTFFRYVDFPGAASGCRPAQ